MSETILNPHWYRIANLKLTMHGHVRSSRHVYRGKVWHILHLETTGKNHRFNENAYNFIKLIDGNNTVDEIWAQLNNKLGDDAPTQDEVINLLGKLYFADCLVSDMGTDLAELVDRRKKQRKQLFKAKYANPMAIKIALLDPDKFLSRWMHWVRPLFSKTAVIMGLGLMLYALVEMWRNWSVISNHVSETTLQPSNLLILLLAYPVVKVAHELGHGFAVKHWGGEVHEMGIMLLVFMPVPYVDASASGAFTSKYRRMTVAAAGIVIELVLASVALLLWLNIQQGMVSDIVFNIMIIGGVSTLLFNGNPLLRFDGYYVLADAAEIPGLGARANKYIMYLVKKYIFAVENSGSPVTAEGERYWFVIYGVAAFIYRMVIMLAIVLFIANKYFFIGVALGLWLIVKQVFFPLGKAAEFLFGSAALVNKRARALALSFVAMSVFGLFIFSVPVPLNTVTEGVVWLPDRAYVRAASNGFVEQVLRVNGDKVQSDEPVIVTENVLMQDEYALLLAQLAELESKYSAALQENIVEAEIINDELKIMHNNVDRMREKLAEMTVTSPVEGVFVLSDFRDLTGYYVKQGDTLAYAIKYEDLSVRVAVPQDSIGLVRKRTKNVQLRLVSDVASVHSSSVIREIPAATYILPSKALAVGGGGQIITDPFDSDGVRTKQQYFQFDVSLPADVGHAYIGQRVYVRFSHGYEALATQWYRALSELFLDELGKV